MTKTIFITATGTNVGKTYTTLKLMELFCAKGIKAVPFKPIETGVNVIPVDTSLLLQRYSSLYQDNSLKIEDICPYRFALPAAPFVAKGLQEIDLVLIKECLSNLRQKADVVLIEGAGGLFVPIDKNFFMIDMGAMLSDFTILVSHTGLGCINDALLSKKALEDKKIPHALVFNRRENDEFNTVSRPFFESYLEELVETNSLDIIVEGVNL